MTCCAVPGCKNRGKDLNRPDRHAPGISFHVFPSDEPRRSKWIKAIGRNNWVPTKYSNLCSAHFRESMIDRTMKRPILLPNAVPTIFPALQKENKNIKDNNACCFVHGCSTGLRTYNNGQELGQNNLKLFSPPHDPVVFEKWKRIIPRGHAELTSNDCICELHFVDDDIERYYVTEFSDGSVKKIKREEIVLKQGAVPFFSDIPPNLAKEAMKLKQLILQHSDEEIQPFNTENLLSANKQNETDLQNVSLAKNFKMAVQAIQVPNRWWGVNSISEFIICTKWNASFYPEKRVVIDEDLKVKVFMKDFEIQTDESLIISTAGDVSCLLQQVDSYELCERVNDKSATNCMKYVKRGSKGQFSSCCNACKIAKKKIHKVMLQRKRREVKRFKKLQCLDSVPMNICPETCLQDLSISSIDEHSMDLYGSVVVSECLIIGDCVNK